VNRDVAGWVWWRARRSRCLLSGPETVSAGVGLNSKHKRLLSFSVLSVCASCALRWRPLARCAAGEIALWEDATSLAAQPAAAKPGSAQGLPPRQPAARSARPLLSSALKKPPGAWRLGGGHYPAHAGRTEARFRFFEAPVMDPELAPGSRKSGLTSGAAR